MAALTRPQRAQQNPNPNVSGIDTAVTAAATEVAGTSGISIAGAEEDDFLCQAAAFSREEVLRRRSRRARQLADCYRRQYWALMEEMRVKHRDYYWEFGVSPFEEAVDGDRGDRVLERGGEDDGEMGDLGLGFGGNGRREERKRCAFSMCKSKSMPVTKFCHQHILADRKQTLYKPCNFVTKSSSQGGHSICGKPVLRSAVPSLCHVHFQKAQRNIQQALRKAGINLSSSNRPTPKFSVLISEYVHEIQARRRETLSVSMGIMDTKEEKTS